MTNFPRCSNDQLLSVIFALAPALTVAHARLSVSTAGRRKYKLVRLVTPSPYSPILVVVSSSPMSLLLALLLLNSLLLGNVVASPTALTNRAANSDADQYLAAHNNFRARHGAKALTWNGDLANKAQQWANRCVFEHSEGQLGPYGGG